MNAAGVDGASDGAVPAVPVTPEARAPHRQCIGCGYDVVGLPVDGPCTECGRPVRETVDRFMLRSEPTAAAGVRRARIGFYGILAVLSVLIALLAIAIVSLVVPQVEVGQFVDKIGPERIAVTLCTITAISMGLVTGGLCIAPRARRLGRVAVGLVMPILAFPWTMTIAGEFAVPDNVRASLVGVGLLALGGMALVFARAVRTTTLACDDFLFCQRVRRWTWVIGAWALLVAFPGATLIGGLVISNTYLGDANLRWLELAFRFYSLGVMLPLTVISIATALLLTMRVLKVAKTELGSARKESA